MQTDGLKSSAPTDNMPVRKNEVSAYKMHQILFSNWACPDPLGSLQHSPDLIAVFVGQGREEWEREEDEKERRE